MITEEQILQATGEDFSKLAGEVLQSPSNCLECAKVTNPTPNTYSCEPCTSVNNPCGWIYSDSPLCLDVEAQSIPLTWDSAMKWRGWAVKKLGKHQWLLACMRTMHHGSDFSDNKTYRALLISTLSYMSSRADEAFYIKAACMCKLQSDGR